MNLTPNEATSEPYYSQLRDWLAQPHDTSATSEEWAALDRLVAERDGIKAAYDDISAWLDEALDALGVKTVFDIKGAVAERDRLRKALERIAEWTELKSPYISEYAASALDTPYESPPTDV
jgi:hypothetical protein